MPGQHIELEDHGQDFLTFDLTDDGKIANANQQGWIWNGRKIANAPLKRGSQVVFENGNALNYRVFSVRKMKVAA